MKKIMLLLAGVCTSFLLVAQEKKYVSASLFTTQNAMPFGKFTGLFSEPLHPGLSAGYGTDFVNRKKSQWFVEINLSLFYHRFVQMGIPVNVKLGYRKIINNKITPEIYLGGGYLHSIPAVAKLKLDGNGEYVKNKHLGRAQADAVFGFSLGYKLNEKSSLPASIIAGYQQMVQFPFVKSYVPLLPYNSFMIGVRKSIK